MAKVENEKFFSREKLNRIIHKGEKTILHCHIDDKNSQRLCLCRGITVDGKVLFRIWSTWYDSVPPDLLIICDEHVNFTVAQLPQQQNRVVV